MAVVWGAGFQSFWTWVLDFFAALSRLSGWRRNLVAMGAGGVTVLALAPYHLWLVPLFSFSILLILLDGALLTSQKGMWGRFRVGAALGWFFGFGYFLAGLYWIGSAFLVEAEKFAWLMPFAVSIFPAGLALFFGLATGLASSVWSAGVSRCVFLAVSFGVVEWTRGHVLTGFPWNSVGYTVLGQDLLLQSASLVGVYGVGVFAVLLYTLPGLFLSPVSSQSQDRSFVRRGHNIFILLLLFGAFAFGFFRVPTGAQPAVPNVNLRVVQPNIAQTDKWRPDKRAWIFSRFLDLSERDGKLEKSSLKGRTHLIWPESALPFLLARSPDAQRALSDILPSGVTFLTGALRMEDVEHPSSGLVRRRFFNSFFVTDADVRLLSTYDKRHLVPFGEYLPFQALLEALGFEQLTRLRGGFATGTGARHIDVPGAPPVGPLICYEVIFSGAVVDEGKRPGWIVNVTNDAWFGDSSGPYQHLHQTRVRAVEEGIPIVRAANTGVSAVIDPFGRMVGHVPLNQAGVLDEALPQALSSTFFARWRDGGLLALLSFFFVYGLVLRRYF